MWVKARLLPGVFAFAAMVLVCETAAADEFNCVGKRDIDGDVRIGGCTAAIQSGRWQGKDLAWAFTNRGAAYDKKGQYDRAIEDLDQAIRLDPQFALAFYNRGIFYNSKDQYDRAIENYDQAITLNPNYADAFYKRGNAYYAKGERDRALQDFKLGNQARSELR